MTLNPFLKVRQLGGRPLILSAIGLGLVLPAIVICLASVPAAKHTRVALVEQESGRVIFSAILRDGEEAVLRWRNSLFGLDVTEVFHARKAALVLDEITFEDQGGLPPPEVRPVDVDDLYHTGGAFTARGIGKPFHRVAYRVAQIGNPVMKIRDRMVAFRQEVGFGGVVVLTAGSATWYEVGASRLE